MKFEEEFQEIKTRMKLIVIGIESLYEELIKSKIPNDLIKEILLNKAGN